MNGEMSKEMGDLMLRALSNEETSGCVIHVDEVTATKIIETVLRSRPKEPETDEEKLDFAIMVYFSEKKFPMGAKSVQEPIYNQPHTIHPTNCTAGFLGKVLQRARWEEK